MDGDCGPLLKAPQRKAVPFPSAVHQSVFICQMRGCAMPMLFWLPMIFISALLELNGFPPQVVANNNPLAA
jgi:hypothetical protein